MAVELATAWVNLVPSTKGIKGQIQSELAGPAESAGREAGGKFSGGLARAASVGLKAGAVGVVAGFGAALTKGFGRLKALDDARFKLQGLGHDAEAVEVIMDSALGAVKGTAFGLGEAATIAASAVAAGIEPGEELERILSITGDTAAIAGSSLGEMGAIFNKVAAGNRLSMEEVNQLADRGIPIMQWLADEYGVTALEAREMVEQGEIDFATFSNVIEENIGGAAVTAGESFGGAFANMGAALGRFGAALLAPAFAAAPDIFGRLTEGIDNATNSIGPLVEWLKRFQTPITVVAGLITAVFIPHLIALGTTAVISAAKQVGAWIATQASAIAAAAVHSAQIVKMVARWVFLGVQSLLHAAKVAAAWFIALGPVGWVIATVVALVALIIANWDTVKRWTQKIWTWVVDKVASAWRWVRETTSRAVAAVVRFFTNLRDRATNLVQRLRDNVVNFFTRLRDRAVALAGNLRDRVVSFFGGLRDRAVSVAGNLRDRVIGFFTGLRDSVVSLAGNLRDRVVSFFTGLRDSVVETVANVIERVKEIKDDVLGFFSGAKDWLLSAGKNIIQGLIDGISSMIGAVGRTVNRAVSAVTDRLPWSPAKKGPFSKRPPEQAGRNITELLAQGMGDKLGLLQKMSNEMASAISPEVDIPSVNVPSSVSSGRVVGGDGASLAGAGARTVEQNFYGPVNDDITGRSVSLALRMV